MTFHSLSGSVIIMEYSLPKTSITLFALPIAIDMCAAERSSNRMTPLKKRKTVAQRDTASHPGVRLWRRYPHSAPGERAPRSSSGVCELARLRAPSSNRMAPQRKEKRHPNGIPFSLEVPPRFELGIEVLQTFALPLGYGTEYSV